jgi:isoleucyl-tRNA synthetase
MTDTHASPRDYSATLFLPKTAFPMRAGLPQREPEFLQRWEDTQLYQQIRARSKGRPRFVLHDGPPYANGAIHIGHALNKILKDMVVRSQQALGFDSPYTPGWDCHGLPIEWKIEEDYRAKGRGKPNLSDPAAINAFRAECRAFAAHWLGEQRTEFKRLGVAGDWERPYSTMAYHAEAQIAREIMKFAQNGLLYRGSKPVMWSVVEKTALAEAEIEYEEHTSDTVFVAFPVKFSTVWPPGRRVEPGHPFPEAGQLWEKVQAASIVIWTTTPWTLPGNRAISFSRRIAYGLYEVTANERDFGPKPGTRYIIAKNLADSVAQAAKIMLAHLDDVPSGLIAETTCAHPLAGAIPPLDGEGGRAAAGRGEGLIDPPHPSASQTPSPARGEGKAAPYSFPVPLLDGDHVTDDAGTGFVHTAPGHGREDFDIWMASGKMLASRGIDTAIPYTVDADGCFTKDAPGFEGRQVITEKGEKGDANEAVIKALIGAGNLVARGRLKHQYPHSWRSKKPVIFRNTPQWFIAMDKPFETASTVIPDARESERAGIHGNDVPAMMDSRSGLRPVGNDSAREEGGNRPTLREVALAAIKQTQWVPASGENRINGMIENRPDWVVSRQRAWGVPITVFVHRDTGEVLKDAHVNAAIAQAFEANGADAWFEDDTPKRILTECGHDPDTFEKVTDVLDVWFDSGSTHSYVLNTPKHFPDLADLRRHRDGGKDRVMYLEGSDQHRGWFHSSLLESCGTRGHAPYDVVLTHGFVLDEKGEKMSKSKGNVVAPQKVIADSGADILRLWVAASDYSDDLRIGPEILKTFVETYRKLRNSIRWMLGSLAHHDASAPVAPKDMPALEQLMLHRLSELDPQIRAAYAEYDYKKVLALILPFMNSDLSAFYFDVRKDTLYCEAPSSTRRHAALQVIHELFRCLTLWLAPILVFTSEEAWLEHYPEVKAADGSVHLEEFPVIPAAWRNEALAAKWETIRDIRRVVTGALEIARAAKEIGSSLEAAPIVHIADAGLRAALEGEDFAEICITSDISVLAGEGPEAAFRLSEIKGVAVEVKRAGGIKCARSWRYFDPATADPAHPDITPRDAAALREWDSAEARA